MPAAGVAVVADAAGVEGRNRSKES
jgi:hypothetical protein